MAETHRYTIACHLVHTLCLGLLHEPEVTEAEDFAEANTRGQTPNAVAVET
jgi:hypothetical protein